MKRLLEKVAAALRPKVDQPAPHTNGFRVHVRIEEPLMAARRITKYQQPLHAALMLARLGHVAGGGSVQGTDGAIHWISLDLRLRDLDGALVFTCAKLRELGAPAGSTLKFQRRGSMVTQPLG